MDKVTGRHDTTSTHDTTAVHDTSATHSGSTTGSSDRVIDSSTDRSTTDLTSREEANSGSAPRPDLIPVGSAPDST